MENEAAVSGVAVQVEEVKADTIYTENTVSGQIVTEEQTTVMAAVNAKCEAVFFEAGGEIRAGQAICRVDLDSTLTSYGAADVSYQSAIQSYNDQAELFEKQIALYEKNVSDLKALYEIGAAAQMEIDQAELQLQSAVAQRNSTLSQLEAGMQSYKANMEQISSSLENIDSNGNILFIVENGSTAKYIEVTAGLTGNGVTEILSGLEAGQLLVTVGQAYLNDGDPVRIVSGPDTSASAEDAGDPKNEAVPEEEPTGEM